MGNSKSKPPPGAVVQEPWEINRQQQAAAEREKKKENERKESEALEIYRQAKDFLTRKITPIVREIDRRQSLIREEHPVDYLDVITNDAEIISTKSELRERLGEFNDITKRFKAWGDKNEYLDPFYGYLYNPARGYLSSLYNSRSILLENRGDNFTGNDYPGRFWKDNRRLVDMKKTIDGEVASRNNSRPKGSSIKYFAMWVPSEPGGGWMGNDFPPTEEKWVVSEVTENLIPIPIVLESTGKKQEDTYSGMTSRDMGAVAPAPSAPPVDDTAPAPSAPPVDDPGDPVNVQGGLRRSKTHRRRRSTSARTSKRLRRRTARASANLRARSARRP